MLNSEIKFNITLDDHRIPERISFDAPDGGVKDQETKAIMLALWDDVNQEALKIDLWTKEMEIDGMKKFCHQVLVSMSKTYKRATNDDETANKLVTFAEEFAISSGIKSE